MQKKDNFNFVTVQSLSLLLYDFYKNYINKLPYYHFIKNNDDGSPKHIVIDIRKPILQEIYQYPKSICKNTIEEAFTSNYRIIPKFYNYSSYERNSSSTWKSNFHIPRSIFLDIIWSNILFPYFQHNLLREPDKKIFLLDKEYVFLNILKGLDTTDFLTVRSNQNITTFEVQFILMNVKECLNVVFTEYTTPTEDKLNSLNLTKYFNFLHDFYVSHIDDGK